MTLNEELASQLAAAKAELLKLDAELKSIGESNQVIHEYRRLITRWADMWTEVRDIEQTIQRMK